MTKIIKIFSDANEVELENEINSFLKETKAEIIDFKFNVSNSEDNSEKITTIVLVVNLPN
jgi:ribose 5-phosphate isomerase RpiB